MTSGPAPGAHLGSYRIESLLGRGGMGVVYLAEHIHLARKVALKVLAPDLAGDDEFRQRFLRESQMAARVEHPNIIPVYDAGQSEDLLYIAMRFIDGMDLKSLILARSPLDLNRVMHVIGQVASSLDAAHAHGLVHRDVKPGNILIEDDRTTYGHVYLTDFGLTKLANSHSSVTKTGMFLGSIDYAAPEQWEGKQLDGRTDIYALGCVAFECLTGEVPYRRESALSAMHAHLMEPPPDASKLRPGLPGAVDAAIRRAMAKTAGERPATCLDFVKEMRGEVATQRAPVQQAPTQQAGVHVAMPVPPPDQALTREKEQAAPPVAAPPDELAPTGVMGAQAQPQPVAPPGGPTAVDAHPGPPPRKIPPFLIGFGAIVLLASVAGAGAWLLAGGGDSQTSTGAIDEEPDPGGGDDKDGTGGGSKNKDGGGSTPVPLRDLRIVYRTDVGGQDDLFVLDGNGVEVAGFDSPLGSETDPAWSKDGTEIAYESDMDGDHDIYVVDADAGGTGGAFNVTDTPTDESNPAWSPDGTQIAFNTGGGGVADIFVVDRFGGAAENLTNSPVDESDPNWSPDGGSIVFESGPEGARDILSVDPNGSTPTPVATPDGDDIDPEWSPDGGKVAFSSDGDIFVVNADGSDLERISDLTSVDTDPTWSPDGRRIAFEADDGTGADIFLVSSSGGEPVPLTNSGSNSDPAFAPE